MSASLNRIFATFSVMEFQQYIEIAILIFLVYKVFIWFKDTKTSALIKGILIITLFVFLVQILNFKVISYLITSALPVVAVALVVLFQNELKMIILKLGDRNVFTRLISQLQGGSGSGTEETLNSFDILNHFLRTEMIGRIPVTRFNFEEQTKLMIESIKKGE